MHVAVLVYEFANETNAYCIGVFVALARNILTA
jgi:hypothetical protein